MTIAANLPHTLERSLVIRARPETVFRFFTDSARWAAWWGEGSTIDARAGGRLVIRYPGGVEAHGEVIEVAPPHRLMFTYGYASGKPIAPGASLVEIRLDPDGDGTRVHLTHQFSDASVRDQHVQGWRYQLSVFANVVSDEVLADAQSRVDDWFSAWSDLDGHSRRVTLKHAVTAAVQFRDRFSTVDGFDDLAAHLDATHQFMPGMRLRRDGDVRHCQGLATCEWTALSPDGSERARGTNVFVFDTDGRITSVTGLWHQSPHR